MDVLIVAATPYEIAPLTGWLEKNAVRSDDGRYVLSSVNIELLISGVGPVSAAWALGRRLATAPLPDWCLQAGVAGAFDPELYLGDVVHVASERWGDVGVEESDGSFSDVFDMGLADPNGIPYINGVLHNPGAAVYDFLPTARGLTVSRVHGTETSIEAITNKYPDVGVESMEGAAFFYACLHAGVSFVEIRSISNRVEKRNRDLWDLPLAIEQLNEVVIGMVEALK